MKKRLLSLALVVTMMCSLLVAIPVSAASMFSDVNGHWAQTTIEELASRGIVNGKGEGLYDPEGKVTRAEFSKLLVCTVENSFSSELGSLSDVPEDAWFNAYVYEALDRGVFYLNELNNNCFMPNEAADRETVAVWAVRLLGIEGEATSTPFVDNASIDNKVAVATAYNQGIISGDAGTGKFRPDDSLTRAEAATIIKRVMNRFQEISGVRAAKNEVDFNDTIPQFEATEDMNVLVSADEEKGIFVFDKINDDIKNLKVGDLFLIKPCDAIPTGVAIKVYEIKIEGSKATITQGDIKLEDVIDEIDVSDQILLSPEHIVEGSLAEGVTLAYTGSDRNNNYLAYNGDNLLADSSAKVKLGENEYSVNTSYDTDGKFSINFSFAETMYKDSNGASVKLSVKGAIKDFTVNCDISGKKASDINIKLTETHTEELSVDVTGSKKWDALKTKNVDDQYDRSYQNDPLGFGTTNGQVTPGLKKDRDALRDEIYKLWQTELGKSVGDLRKDKQFKKDLKLASVNIPVPAVPGLFVIFDINLTVNATGEASVTISGAKTVTRGVEYTPKAGTSKISQIDQEWGSTIAGEFDARVGASVRGGLTYLYIVTLDVGFDAGLGFNASTEITGNMKLDNDGTVTLTSDIPFLDAITAEIEEGQTRVSEIHTCDICVDLVLYGYLSIDAEAKLGYGIFEITLFNPSWDILNKDNAKIATGYLYFDHDSDPFLGFGFGQCVNKFVTPSINQQSESRECRLNDDLTLSVRVKDETGAEKSSGQGLLTTKEGSYIYQWYKDNIAIDGANSNIYQLASMTESDFGTYKCIVALKEMPSIYKISNEIKITEEAKVEEEQKEEKVEAKTVTKTGSVSENKNSSFTFMPTDTGTYHFKNIQGSVVIINIDGEYKSNEGYYALVGGHAYTVNVEWGYEDTNYAIQITGPITY